MPSALQRGPRATQRCAMPGQTAEGAAPPPGAAGHLDRLTRARTGMGRMQDGGVQPKGRVRDAVWVGLTSWWTIGLLTVASVYVALTRILWTSLGGPGDRAHHHPSRVFTTTGVPVVHLLYCVTYHLEANSRMRGIQRTFVRQTLVAEALLLSYVGAAYFFYRTFGAGEHATREYVGPNRTAVMGDGPELALTTTIGPSLLPSLLLSVSYVVRTLLLPDRDADPLAPGWLRRSFLVTFLTLISLVTVLCSGLAALGGTASWWVSRYYRRSLVPHRAEALNLINRLLLTGPASPADVRAFAETDYASGGPIALVAADLVVPWTGDRVVWEDDRFARGLVARVMRVPADHGTFVFDVDRLVAIVVLWDTLILLAALLIVVGAVAAAWASLQSLVVRPLELAFMGLQSAGDILRDLRDAEASARPGGADAERSSGTWAAGREEPGAATGRPGAAPGGAQREGPMHLATAVQAVLGAVQNFVMSSSGQRERRRRRTGSGTGSRRRSGSGNGSRRASHRVDDGPEPGGEGASGGPLMKIMVAGGGPGPERARLRFSPTVINHLGTELWSARRLSKDEQIEAAHLMFTKLRCEEVCPREVFVTWVEIILDEHPELPFHNSQLGVETMHAVYRILAVRGSDMGSLSRAKVFLLLCSALGVYAGSQGMRNRELEECGHIVSQIYLGSHAQQQCGASMLVQVARGNAGADVFHRLTTKGKRQEALDQMLSSIVATDPDMVGGITRSLRIMNSQRMVSQGQRLAAQDHSAAKPLWTQGGGFEDTFVFATLVAASLGYAALEPDAWLEYVEREVRQRCQFYAARGGPPGDSSRDQSSSHGRKGAHAPGPAAEPLLSPTGSLRRQGKSSVDPRVAALREIERFWRGTGLPFFEALGDQVPACAPLHAQVAGNVARLGALSRSDGLDRIGGGDPRGGGGGGGPEESPSESSRQQSAGPARSAPADAREYAPRAHVKSLDSLAVGPSAGSEPDNKKSLRPSRTMGGP